MAGHAELEHIIEFAHRTALAGLRVGRDPDHPRATIGQGKPHGAQNRRLGAAAADPALHETVGADHGLVARPRRRGRLHPQHADEGKGLVLLLQALGGGQQVEGGGWGHGGKLLGTDQCSCGTARARSRRLCRRT